MNPEIPEPVEKIDPELGAIFVDICRKKLPARVLGTRVFRISSLGHLYTEEIFTELPGRNDPCLCGSGKKFKKCCMGETQ